jgi:CO dehydrogenase nickel-insertion accessory protein CooC1
MVSTTTGLGKSNPGSGWSRPESRENTRREADETMADDLHVLEGKRIGVFGKGGAGKSTVVVLLAESFRRHGYRVCVVDADSTNAGLAEALGVGHAPVPLLRRFGGTVFTGGPVTCPVDDPVPLDDAAIALDDLEEDYRAQNDRGVSLLTAGKITEDGPGAGCDGPVAKIARDLTVEEEGRAVLTLLDFKAGFEDWARGVITALDWAVVVVDPTTAALEMAGHMKEVVRQVRAGVPPATSHLSDLRLIALTTDLYRHARIKGVLCVLNKVPDEDSERYLRERLARRSLEPAAVIPEDRSIAQAWMRGEPLRGEGVGRSADGIVRALEAAEAPVESGNAVGSR